MIQMQTVVDVADNTGAKVARCIRVLGGTGRRTAHVGDVIIVSIQKTLPGSAVKKGQVARAVIVRTKNRHDVTMAATCVSTKTPSC